MNTLPRILLGIALLTAAFTSASRATVILFDDYSNAASGSLIGQTTSDGNATYDATITSSNFQRTSVTWTEADSEVADSLGSYMAQTFNNPSATTWMNLSSNLDPVSDYTFTIDYLNLTSGAGNGVFAISGRSNSNSLTSIFTLTLTSGNSSIGVNYIDANGTTTSLGTVTGIVSTRAGGSYYLSDVEVRVVGNTQQLFLGGVAYGSPVATQGTYDDGTTDLIRLYAKAGTGAFDVRFDNISVVAVPEPGMAAMIGLGALGLWGFGRARRIHRKNRI